MATRVFDPKTPFTNPFPVVTAPPALAVTISVLTAFTIELNFVTNEAKVSTFAATLTKGNESAIFYS